MALLTKDILSLSDVFYLISAAFVGLVLIFLVRRQKKVRLINKIPGPKGLPILGNALQLDLNSVDLFQKLNDYCEMGEVMRFWVGPVAQCLVSSARCAEVILSSQKHIEKSFDYSFLQPWLGTGLLTSTGNKWRSRRKLLTPAFHFKILEDFLDVFNVQSQKFVRKLKVKADGNPFDIVEDIALCALDVICETAMGRGVNAMDDSESEYVKAVSRIGYLIQQRTMIPWHHPDILYSLLGPAKEHDKCLHILHDFTNNVIKSRRREFQAKKKKQDDVQDEMNSDISEKKKLAFLDILLEYSENGANLSDRDLQEEVDTFMFEGHDTTATAAAFILHLIGSHQDIQNKIYEELSSVFPDKETSATMADLRQLKYLENCIKEGLRLYPSVPIIAREVKEDVNINNYRIPAGTNVNIMTYRIHRDPKQFPDPEVFDPDRFLPENCKNRHPYAYIPFSAGPRNCIGQKFAMMESKTLISTILRHYHIESVVKKEDLKVTGDLILRSEEGIIVKLFPRN